VARSDHELAVLADAARRAGRHLVAGVSEGDLLATVGVQRERLPAEQHHHPVDLGLVSLDGGDPVPFVAHVVARRRLWAGELVVMMNAAWWGDWYLGPRAHPNDGLVDITVGSLPVRQRLLARSRARTGSHLPHPGLRTLRRSRWSHGFERPTGVWVDGRHLGRCRHLEVSVEPGHLTLVV
jgi:hypothetical protein